MKNLSALLGYIKTPTIYIDNSYFLILNDSKIIKYIHENFFEYINNDINEDFNIYLKKLKIINILLSFNLCKPINISYPQIITKNHEKLSFIDQFLDKNFPIKVRKAIDPKNLNLIGVFSELHYHFIEDFFNKNHIIINKINPIWSSKMFNDTIKNQSNFIVKIDDMFINFSLLKKNLIIENHDTIKTSSTYYQLTFDANLLKFKKFIL